MFHCAGVLVVLAYTLFRPIESQINSLISMIVFTVVDLGQLQTRKLLPMSFTSMLRFIPLSMGHLLQLPLLPHCLKSYVMKTRISSRQASLLQVGTRKMADQFTTSH